MNLCFVWKPVRTERHLPTLPWQWGSWGVLCVAVLRFHCYQTSVNVGQHTAFLFLPLAFISAGETSTKQAVHSSGLSGLARSRCSVNLWREPVAISSLIFLYGLYMQNGCRSNFFNSRLYGLAEQLSQCWPQMFVLERHIEGNIFSLIHINRRASVSVSVSVCKKKKNLPFVFCTWKEESCYSVYDKVLRTLYIRALLICGDLIIPVCTLLLIFKHCVISCTKYWIQGFIGLMMMMKKKKQITSFLPNGGKNSSGMTIIVTL